MATPPVKRPCHDHQLELLGTSEIDGKAASCRACGHPFSSDYLYGCRLCGFFVHRPCAMSSLSIQGHPLHPKAPIHLSYEPSNSFGSAPCNGCGQVTELLCEVCGKKGGGWSYRCNSGDFVVHFLCAHMPRTARKRGHDHSLHLSFDPPTGGSKTCHACHHPIHHCYYKYCYYKCSSSSCDLVLHPGCMSKPLATNTERNQSTKIAWRLTKLFARKVSMHLLFDFIGLGEAMDIVLFGSDDVVLLEEAFDWLMEAGNTSVDLPPAICRDNFKLELEKIIEKITFDSLVEAYGVDDPLQEEFTSLLLAHMERMDADTGASSSSVPP